MEWINARDKTPDLIKYKDYSENVLAVLDGKLAVMTYCFNYDGGGENCGYFWANCYGNIDGECEWDDDYQPTHWMPLPLPPKD